jgi:hypothetical protein
LMEQGNPEGLFKSTSQFKGGKDINNLTQIKTQQIGVNVLPFWGEQQQDEVGISRVDVDLNYEIKPKAMFIGSIFGDNEKNSINKNCQARKKTGKVCETVPVDGFLQMIRKRPDGEVENYSVKGGDVIDDDGVWAYQIPMNLDYMTTDEYGNLIPTEEPNKGIPTRTRVRFKLDTHNTGEEGRLRTRANYLIPHNPSNKDEIDYEFGDKTKEESFRDLYWNKIYSVKNFIPRLQGNDNFQNRNFVGFKDVDDCSGNKTPLPFNRMDKDLNPIYSIICMIITIVLWVISLVNDIITWEPTIKIFNKRISLGRPFCGVGKCISFECNGEIFYPGCGKVSSKANCYVETTNDKREKCLDGKCKVLDCYQYVLAEALNVYEFDFYNDWVNGSLYSLLLKYKSKRNGDKFCNVDENVNNYLHDTMVGDKFNEQQGHKQTEIKEGIVKQYNDELFYAPTTKDGRYRLLATDIINLGTIQKYDWQGQPSLHGLLTPTTYKIPPVTPEEDGPTAIMDYGDNTRGLLFDLKCTHVSVDDDQARSIKRLCEIGVGLDEDRFGEPGGKGADEKITSDDIDNQFSRDVFILLNDQSVSSLPKTGLTSGFEGKVYKDFRSYNNLAVPQPNNSLYFYFGTEPNRSAIEKMNKKYFETCVLDTNIAYGDDTE